jgi:hypothetical protein
MIKLIPRVRTKLEVLVSWAPTPSPMGIMDISAPRVKKPIPIIRSAAPARNIRIVPAGMGTRITLAISTIAVMGSTDEKASIIFSFNILFMPPPMHRDTF